MIFPYEFIFPYASESFVSCTEKRVCCRSLFSPSQPFLPFLVCVLLVSNQVAFSTFSTRAAPYRVLAAGRPLPSSSSSLPFCCRSARSSSWCCRSETSEETGPDRAWLPSFVRSALLPPKLAAAALLLQASLALFCRFRCRSACTRR